jgi:hypothetical protein
MCQFTVISEQYVMPNTQHCTVKAQVLYTCDFQSDEHLIDLSLTCCVDNPADPQRGLTLKRDEKILVSKYMTGEWTLAKTHAKGHTGCTWL